jgi:hypothetical protein
MTTLTKKIWGAMPDLTDEECKDSESVTIPKEKIIKELEEIELDLITAKAHIPSEYEFALDDIESALEKIYDLRREL